MSPDDGGIVLLEDFAKLPNVLDFSLDVGAVRKGMAGPTMAQRQFYFVDACRVRPEAAVRFQTLGTGVGLPNPFEGKPRVSAIYFAATPSTEALGAPGDGTLFVQALLECLDTALGVDDHVQQDGSWAVTSTTLVRELPKRVRELADAAGEEQTATIGGQLEDVPFHSLKEPPQVPITLTLAPDGAAACAVAALMEPPGQEALRRGGLRAHDHARGSRGPLCAVRDHQAADATVRRRPALHRAGAPAELHRRS